MCNILLVFIVTYIKEKKDLSLPNPAPDPVRFFGRPIYVGGLRMRETEEEGRKSVRDNTTGRAKSFRN